MKPKQEVGALVPLQAMARHLGVPVRWLRDQAASGAVPGLRAGNRWLFCAEAVTAAVRSMASDDSVGELLRRYAEAVQSGDDGLRQSAFDELKSKYGVDLALVDPIDLANMTPPKKSKGGDQ